MSNFLHHLAALFLDGTQITDAGLVYIENLTNLEEWLGLYDTRVTDAGLRHLKKFNKLKQLDLQRTQVTEKGARELKPFISPPGDVSVGP